MKTVRICGTCFSLGCGTEIAGKFHESVAVTSRECECPHKGHHHDPPGVYGGPGPGTAKATADDIDRGNLFREAARAGAFSSDLLNPPPTPTLFPASPFSDNLDRDSPGGGGRESGGSRNRSREIASNQPASRDTEPLRKEGHSAPPPAAAQPPAPIFHDEGGLLSPRAARGIQRISDSSKEEHDMESYIKEKKGEGGNAGISDAVLKEGVAEFKEQAALVPATTPTADTARMITAEDADRMIAAYKAFEKVKAALFREGTHYVLIEAGGRKVPHVKKEGALVLAARFGVDIPHALTQREYEYDENRDIRKATVRMVAQWAGREVEMTGICNRNELRGEKTDHNVVTKAETRAYKRAVLAILGSADPIADEE